MYIHGYTMYTLRGYTLYVHGYTMYINFYATSLDLHGISMDIQRIFHVYVGHLHIHDIYHVYA
jgi:hypothetical protein